MYPVKDRDDAETGSADYSMARTNPNDTAKLRAMLERRLEPRDDPFPRGRPPTLDDLVFLPANPSRLVIDPYREACRMFVPGAPQGEGPQPRPRQSCTHSSARSAS